MEDESECVSQKGDSKHILAWACFVVFSLWYHLGGLTWFPGTILGLWLLWKERKRRLRVLIIVILLSVCVGRMFIFREIQKAYMNYRPMAVDSEALPISRWMLNLGGRDWDLVESQVFFRKIRLNDRARDFLLSGKPLGEMDDPNSPGDKIRSATDEHGSTFYYSIGPDRRDDRTQILYDTTNGTFSTGDIVIRP